MPLTLAPEQHVLLHGIRWQTYERLLEDLQDRHIRLTYDAGTLEIVSPSRSHERVKHLIRRLVEAMTEELGVAIEGGGSTTWRREDLDQGLEPDECYWIENEPNVRGRRELDLRVDPPPDLAIEVDVHASSVDRMKIYAALGVPEVWRWKDDRIAVHLRQGHGGYAVSERSACFPWLPVGELAAWVLRDGERDENSLIRAFRLWLRESVTLP
ncbi:MAG: Uma2 family endonuclease [Planctomycetota bacterium]